MGRPSVQAFPVKVENRGAETVRVEGASCSCTGLSTDPDRFELAPGGSREIQVTLDLSAQSRTGPEPRPFTAALRLRYSTPSREVSEQSAGDLRGSVKPVLLTKPVWNLGLYSKASGPIERRFEVTAAIPLAALDVTIPLNPWRLTVTAKPRADRLGVYDVIVRSDAPTVAGLLRSEVVFRPTTTDGVSLPPQHVTVEADIAASDVRIDPAELYIGGTRIGGTVETRVNVTSLSGRAVQVERVEPVGTDLEVTPGDGANEFRVKKKIMRVGSVSDVVWFTVRSKDGVERVRLVVEAVGVKLADP